MSATNSESFYDFSFQQTPPSRKERDRIVVRIESLEIKLPLTKNRLKALAEAVVEDKQYMAWAMVLIGSRAWRDQIVAIPCERRLLLLPHCMKNIELCLAKYDRDGLLCEQCGACELGELKSLAESLGYHVMIAEGSPVVMQWILSGKADAILGIGCLRSLERAFDKLQLAGIPAMAVPLHDSTCRNSKTDLDRAIELIRTPFDPEKQAKNKENYQPTWVHLLRGAVRLFEKPVDSPETKTDPIKWTRRLGSEFVSKGGKYFRPFITLAVYDALTGSRGITPNAVEYIENDLPDWLKDIARAVEVFHKASLIHDDIEDEDVFRYGEPTLHTTHGTAMAINVGDYLIGCGYRLIAGIREQLNDSNCFDAGNIVCELLFKLSEAHLRLCEGQGAELAWQSNFFGKDCSPDPADILKIYVLKTSPAFEAAMGLGVLAAVAEGTVDWSFYRQTQQALARISRHLGVAFQIRNDLDDWLPDRMNKRITGGDAKHGRPTLLLALSGLNLSTCESMNVTEIETFFHEKEVFEKGRRLIKKYAVKATEATEEVEHLPLRRLLLHFIETIASS